ncbi:MAG: exodeoxyribonuclease VII large subunit [Methanobrevibacter sp.]|uniref:exodeoxyribonuclease VII large subunit n=1 Tax=Methanobrevibacter sp. TaxID=66852 RepID=UPI0026DEC465|nr:exodeoxyribonuclease VII large subunit [Methanobrevibacter sp.]MDO5848329.1 exodeoxyribonuclease VII large subunit [Methanobrevibacter sp.]
MEEKFISVSHLNHKLKMHVSKGPFKNILVEGELSDISTSKRGFSYFKLKDEKSTIDCIVYPRILKKSPQLKEGLNIEIKGSVEVYKPHGKCQIKVNKIKEAGLGKLFEKLQQLTEKLESEGLFEDDHKKEIPRIPKKIGIITSKTGAAIKDIITTIERRWPYCNAIIFPSLVQGKEAPKNLIKQLKHADEFGCDTLIIGRGGGSIEDLWAFNNEQLARAVYSCRTPIISAVGHQRDTTLIDYVADRRAATPTAAAELAVPNVKEIEGRYSNLKSRLENSLNRTLSENRQRLDFVLRSNVIRNPFSIFDDEKMRFESSVYKIKASSNKIHDSKRNRLNELTRSFRYYSKTLETSKRNQLEKLIDRFGYSSEKYQNAKRNQLNDLTRSFRYHSETMGKSKRSELEKLTSRFSYSSEKYQNAKRNQLEKLTTKFDYTSKRYANVKRTEFDLLKKDFKSVSNNMVFTKKTELNSVKNSRILRNPQRILQPKMRQYDRMYEKLEVVNPLNSLKRGYTIAKKDKKAITSVKDLDKDDIVEIQFKDGNVNTKVI